MTTARRVLPLALLVALVAGGCGGAPAGGPSGVPAEPMPRQGASTVGAEATTTPAAELRAGLTWQLVERTHLLEHARGVLLRSGSRTAPAVRAAEELLEDGAADLARTVGIRSGPLVAALRAEVDVVLAPRLDPAALADSHARTAELLARLAPTLRADALAQALDRSTAGLAAPSPVADGAAAAVAAGLVANAVAARDALGSTETSAVVLRADLTRLLVGRAHLAGAPATGSPLEGLTETLGRRLVPGLGQPEVRAALRAGHTALHSGATAVAAGDDDLLARSRTALAAADRDLAARLAAAVPALPPALVLRELDPARGPLLAAAGARATGTDDAPALASAAARRAVVTAAVLSAGIAEEQGLR